MKKSKIFIAMLAMIFAACNTNHNQSNKHHEEEEAKLKITAYSSEFEVFAEADPFVVGDTGNILSHFSYIPSFHAIDTGSVTIHLIVGSSEVKQTLEHPNRKGIYSFNIKPENAGKGKIIFDISTPSVKSQIITSEITVFSDKHEAEENALKLLPSNTNTIVFTKEQSWKIRFATGYPDFGPFGQVIKTTAQVKSALADETVIASKAGGMVIFSDASYLEGMNVSSGQTLFTVSGNELADNNTRVKFEEAKNNYNKAKADYDRQKELSADKIISEKELLASKTEYENAKSVYENLSKNFSANGQSVVSPISGFIKMLYVANGQYVETGQKLASITKNKSLLLQADVQQKYASVLSLINDAVIRTVHDNHSYTLKELNGKILSYGKSTNEDNYLIPVNIAIDNIGGFVAGGFVDIFLKAGAGANTLTVPVSALLEEQGNYSVLVQVHPELFEKREVTVGTTDGLNIEILSGITRNDRIVTKGAVMVKLAQATNALDPHSGHTH